MKSEYKPVFKASLWSVLLLGVYILILASFKSYIFKWSDPTGDIRNVVLIGIGITGVPFLILGHVTRRQDFESKRQDLNYRSEASVNEFLMSQVSISAERFAEIVRVDFSIPDREFQNSRTSNLNDLYQYTLYDPRFREYDIITVRDIDDLRNDLLFHFSHWEELNKHLQILMTSLRSKREFLNSNFGKILMINMSSYLNEEAYSALIFTLCLKEFGRIDLENDNSDLSIAFSEIQALTELKIFSTTFSSRMREIILEFEKAEGMMKGREQ